jgi:hypothetical protein
LRILIIDTYYPQFLDAFYAKRPALGGMPYQDQWRALMGEFFGTADAYSHGLNALGEDACEAVPNCAPLQRAWAREHGVTLPPERPRLGLRGAGFRRRPALRSTSRWMWHVLVAQIKELRPDVVYVQDIAFLSAPFIKEYVRPYARLLVGQHAATLPTSDRCGAYDLILSSLPNQVEFFRTQGVSSEYFKIGFDERVLEHIGAVSKQHNVAYVGGLASAHSSRIALLEQVARRLDIDCWGYGSEALKSMSPIRKNFHGTAWGLDMYRIRAGAKIVVNGHSSAADGYANNMCLFESTGVGTLLVTEAKRNLSELFEVGTEVVSYENANDCVEKLEYYLAHDEERERIARAGQKRTLREHTYRDRMSELVAILHRFCK